VTAKSKQRGHQPRPDPAVPADQHGHAYCSRCGLAIVDGDPRHTLPELPADDAMSRAAGEREET
jgi:hypothetical protein